MLRQPRLARWHNDSDMADVDEPLKRADSLFEDAERCQEQGRFEDAEKLLAEAKKLVAGIRRRAPRLTCSAPSLF